MKIQNEIITSRQNPTVKWAASLADKKGREEERSFIAEGIKLTLEAASAGLPVTKVFLSEAKREQYFSKLVDAFSGQNYEKTELITVSESAFSKISTEKAPEGVISVIKYLDFFEELNIIYKEVKGE